MQALAMAANGSVTVLSHPSLAGMATGSGISGSTAWHGAFRFRMYLSGVKADKGEQPETDLRGLEFKKNQYGPLGETVALRWQNGLFVPERSGSALDTLARQQEVDDAFLNAMTRLIQQGLDLSPHPTANNYAPTLIAKQREAKDARMRKAELTTAFDRLLAANRIHIVIEGPASRQRKRVLVGGRKEPEGQEGFQAFRALPGSGGL
jgi:RecA-family ATPase